VLVNLIGNSLKFTFQGHVDVSLKYDFSNQDLHVTVSDTGIGIKEEEKKKLFEMFCRIEQTVK
jgi:signal transduction histidine kinase